MAKAKKTKKVKEEYRLHPWTYYLDAPAIVFCFGYTVGINPDTLKANARYSVDIGDSPKNSLWRSFLVTKEGDDLYSVLDTCDHHGISCFGLIEEDDEDDNMSVQEYFKRYYSCKELRCYIYRDQFIFSLRGNYCDLPDYMLNMGYTNEPVEISQIPYISHFRRCALLVVKDIKEKYPWVIDYNVR